MRDIRCIVVHCSATRPNQLIGAAEIRRWHQDQGWADIGYHFVIRRDGTMEPGRKLHVMGAHVKDHNRYTVGICLVGGISLHGPIRAEDNYTLQQYRKLLETVLWLRETYPEARICGHRDLSPDLDKDGVVEREEWVKECPCFDVAEWCLAVGLDPKTETYP